MVKISSGELKMSRNSYLSTFIFAVFSLVIVTFGNAQAASPVEKAVTGWMQSLKDLGASVAKYDAIRIDEASDTATIENLQVSWDVVLPEEIAAVAVAFQAREVILEGFREQEDGYAIARYILSDDNKITVSGTDDQGVPFRLEGSMTGAVSEGLFYPKFTPVAEDPKRPVSKYLKLYDLFLKVAVKKSFIDKIVMVQSIDGKTFLNLEYNGMTTMGMANGRIEEMRVKSYRQIFSIPEDAGDIPFSEVETTYGEMIQKGVDFKPIIEAIDGRGKEGDTDYKTVVELASVSDVKFRAGPVSVSIDQYKMAGLKLRPGTLSLLQRADRAVLGEEVRDQEALSISLNFMRGFALDEFSISNLQASGPSNVSGKMTKFVISNLSNEGLGEIAIEGFDMNGPEGEKASLGIFSIGKVIFPAIEDLIAAAENGPPNNPMEAAALSPKIGKFEIADLFVDPKIKPEISLGLFRILQSNFIGAIPTDIKINTENLKLPVAYIEDAMAQAVLQSLGYEVLKITSMFALKWDEASQELTLKSADVTLEDGARIKIKAGVAGVPKSVIENPQTVMKAMPTLAFRNVNFLIEDAVLVSGLIDYFAKIQNMPPEGLRAMIIQIIESQAGPLAGTPFVAELKTALSAFLENPKRLSLDLDPPAPVPFTQMLGTVSTTPDQMPTLLGANVSAN
jgi:hypothetical protein